LASLSDSTCESPPRRDFTIRGRKCRNTFLRSYVAVTARVLFIAIREIEIEIEKGKENLILPVRGSSKVRIILKTILVLAVLAKNFKGVLSLVLAPDIGGGIGGKTAIKFYK